MGEPEGSTSQDNHFIRSDYQPRSAAQTFVEDASGYWNADRIAASGRYQYHVYAAFADAIRRRGGAGSVADVGCGYPTKLAELIRPLTRHLTVFDQPSMAELVRSRFPMLEFVPIDLETPGEPPARFDYVVCADVIEHLLDPDPLLDFLFRLARPEGLVYLSTPERDVMRGPDCLSSPNPEHVREWTATEFHSYLESRGVRVRQQILPPAARVTKLEELFSGTLGRLRVPRYAGCQLLICERRD
jgi:SAM-dependent methyltransferase